MASAALLFTTPVLASDFALGGAAATINSFSTSSGVAVTGGIAANGFNGSSTVQNFSAGVNTSFANGELSFKETDYHTRKFDVDGINVDLEFETGSISEQISTTTISNTGSGTAGFGGGVGISGGSAHATGGWIAGGSSRW